MKFSVGQVVRLLYGDGLWLPFYAQVVAITWDKQRRTYRYAIQPDIMQKELFFQVIESQLAALTDIEKGA